MYDNLLGEFFGTLILIVFGCGVCATCSLEDSKGKGGGWICIAFGWGFAVTFGVFTSISLGAPQGDINPAVTLGKMLAGVYTFQQFLATSAVQILGGIVGAAIVWLAYLPHWEKTPDPAAKRGVFCTAPAIRSAWKNFLCEFIATFFLLFMIWAIFSKLCGPFVPGYGPYIVGILIVGLGLSLGGPTGYAMNPARDLGPRLAHFLLPIAGKGDSDFSYGWIPVVAPLVGAAAAYFVAHGIGML